MTAPGGDTVALVQAIKDNAARLGLTWQMQYGTVRDGADPAALKVQFDADTGSLATPDVVSLVGAFAAGDRVGIITTPEGGAYAIGPLGGGGSGSADPVVYIDGASSVTNVAGITAETTVLTLANFRFEAGTGYQANISMDVLSGGSATAALWRIRKTSVAGALLGIGVWNIRAGVGSNYGMGELIVVNTAADIVDNVVVTLERVGAGTITFNTASTQVGWLRLYRLTTNASRLANAISV